MQFRQVAGLGVRGLVCCGAPVRIEARDTRGLLAPVYRSFTKGFESLDLREAKAMLEELAH